MPDTAERVVSLTFGGAQDGDLNTDLGCAWSIDGPGKALGKCEGGAKVVVLGAGPMGLAAVFWARRMGAGKIVIVARSRH